MRDSSVLTSDVCPASTKRPCLRGASSHSAFATGLFPGEKFTSYRDNLALPSCSIGFPHMRCLQPAEGSIKMGGLMVRKERGGVAQYGAAS